MTDPTPLEEAKRILVALLRDPDQVVLDPDHAWEEADGTQTWRKDAPRRCLVTLMERVSDSTHVPYRALDAPVRAALGRGSYVQRLRELGGPGCADQIEAAKP